MDGVSLTSAIVDAAMAVVEDTPQRPQQLPIGVQIGLSLMAAAVPVGTLFLTVRGSKYVDEKTRYEAMKVRMEVEDMEKARGPSSTSSERIEADIRSARAVAASTETLIMRFVLLFIALQIWAAGIGILLDAIDALLQNVFRTELSSLWYRGPTALSVVVELFFVNIRSIGTLVILFALGRPLLTDIARSYDLRLRDLVRRRSA